MDAIIEREIFNDLDVASDVPPALSDVGILPQRSITLSRFKKMMERDDGRRRSIVSRISIRAHYLYSLESEEARSDAGQAVNNEHFSRSIHKMWKVLEDWGAANRRPLTLDLAASSMLPPKIDARCPQRDKPYLHLTGAPLPRLRGVGSFELDDDPRIWPPSLFRMVGSMTALTSTTFVFDDMMGDDELRQQYREDLGKSLSLIPPTCTDFEARFCSRYCAFDSEEPVVAASKPDILCINLRRHLATHLRDLRLDCLRVSPALFWPSAFEQQQQQQPLPSPPSWPHLEILEVVFEQQDSYGLFHADHTVDELTHYATLPARDRMDLSLTRSIPRPERGLYQLFAAAGRAVRLGGMPRLERLHATGQHVKFFFGHWNGDEEFEINWKSIPSVAWTDEMFEAWGLAREDCRVDSSEGDPWDGRTDWLLEADVPWR
ncbi:hypothetical protein SLS55_010388 [Diplodia seriata]|uniref:Oxoglutarate iron-dependent oxygenase n=1 Tax=Diplodia seriata TaxID=420778 RepID=A0ABR3BYD3_9PEZI